MYSCHPGVQMLAWKNCSDRIKCICCGRLCEILSSIYSVKEVVNEDVHVA